MTPDEFNALVRKLATALREADGVNNAQAVILADDKGTSPEIAVEVDGIDLMLVAEVI